MAFDLLLMRETDADWSIDPEARKEAAEKKALPIAFTANERRALGMLEPSTRTFVVHVISWARGQGIAARLSSTTIYTPEQSASFYEEGRSGIKPGRLDWHNVGRAFHLVIPPLGSTPNYDAYAMVGKYVREQGGEWLGDKPIRTPKGIIYDTAHFEYHPGFDIGTYRKSDLARLEFSQAQKRARQYA